MKKILTSLVFLFLIFPLFAQSLPDLWSPNPNGDGNHDHYKPGVSYTFTISVKNSGTAYSDAVKVSLYLSDDKIFSADDQYIADAAPSFPATSISPNGTLGYIKKFTFPSVPEAGEYYILFYVDSDMSEEEENENNNISSFFITAGNHAGSKVITTGEYLSTSYAAAGSDVNVGSRLRNVGNSDAYNAKVEYYLSTDKVKDASDVLLGSDTEIYIYPGNSFYKSNTLTIPGGTADGLYYLLFTTTETDYLPLQIGSTPGAIPDLQISSITTTETTVLPGEDLHVDAGWNNAGNAVAGECGLAYYISPRPDFDTLAIFVTAEALDILPAAQSGSGSVTLKVPSHIKAGTWYAMSRIDYLSTVIESDETNNVSSVSFQVDPLPGPDLEVTTVTVSPDPALEQSSINLTATVKNTGSLSAGSSQVYFYISSNSIFEETDWNLVNVNVSSLATGAEQEVSTSYTLPSWIDPGNFTIYTMADGGEVISEQYEDNNLDSTTLTVSLNAADFTISNVSPDAASAETGQDIRVSYTASNIGTKADYCYTGFYISTDAILDGGDTYLEYKYESSINPGSNYNTSNYIDIPASVAAGQYYIILKADYNDSKTELDESNNTACASIEIEEAKPDLSAVTISYVPSWGTWGNNLNLSVNVRNYGGIASPAFETGYYLSADRTLDGADILLGTKVTSDLGVGAGTWVGQDVTVPAGIPEGNYYILFVIDHDNQVPESVETNNMDDWAYLITDGTEPNPDLEVTSTQTSLLGAVSNSVYVSGSVVNNGNFNSLSTTYLHYYLSSDAIFDGADTYLTNDNVSDLDPGESSPESANVTIPAGTVPGDYYVILVADGTEVCAESNEANNTLAIPLEVVASMEADLLISECRLPADTVSQGVYLYVYATVHNAGLSSSSSSAELGYYYSTDTLLDGSDVYMAKDYIGSLSAGAYSSEQNYYWRVPTSISGTYYVLFVADYGNDQTESDEENNLAWREIYIKEPPKSDLTVTQGSLSVSATMPGERITAYATLKNIGEADAYSSTRLGYFISSDSIWDAGDTYLDYDYIGSYKMEAGVSINENQSFYLPTDLTTGTSYFILLIADYQLSENEEDESNNYYGVKIDILDAPPGPDYIVESASLDADTIYIGGSVYASAVVANIGGAATYTSYLGYYLSEDDLLDAGDSRLTTDAVYGLSAGGNSSEYATLYPSVVSEGDYFILFVADYDLDVAEDDETNNVEAVPLFIREQTYPDLEISSLTLVTDNRLPGETLEVDAQVWNSGNANAGSSRVYFYLSVDANFDAGTDSYFGYKDIAGINAGATLDVSHQYTIPAGQQPGNYYIIAMADGAYGIVESDETNNTSAVSLNISTPPRPEIIAENLAISTSLVKKDHLLDINFDVNNTGLQDAANFSTSVFIADQTDFSGTEYLLSTINHSLIQAGTGIPFARTLTMPSSLADGDWYVVVVTDVNSDVMEEDETNNKTWESFTFCFPVTIGSGPADAPVCPGEEAGFQVSASGTAPITYHWFINGMESGSSESLLTTQSEDAVVYVEVSNLCDTVSSPAAQLEIKTALTINSSPASFTACPGTEQVLSVSAEGAGSLNYTWKKNGSDWDAGSAELYFPSISSMDEGNYSVTITDECSSLNSEEATVTVVPELIITMQPESESFCSGESGALEIVASGSGVVDYEWFHNEASTGETGTVLDLTQISPEDVGEYYAVVSDDCASLSSEFATISLVEPVSITAQPQDMETCEGSAASFTVETDYTCEYQWFQNGSELPGMNGPSCGLSSADAYSAGEYTVKVSNACGEEMSEIATLSIMPDLEISLDESQMEVCEGENLTVTVSDNLEGSNYFWTFEGVSKSNDGQMELSNIHWSDGGEYKVEVSNGCEYDVDTFRLIVKRRPETPSILMSEGVLRSNMAADNYLWFRNSQELEINDREIVPSEDGTYALMIEVEGCLSLISEGVYVSLTGIMQTMDTEISLYPNPASDLLYLETGLDISELSVYDLSGRRTEVRVETGTGLYTLDVSGLPEGLYLIRIIRENQVEVIEFMKK